MSTRSDECRVKPRRSSRPPADAGSAKRQRASNWRATSCANNAPPVIGPITDSIPLCLYRLAIKLQSCSVTRGHSSRRNFSQYWLLCRPELSTKCPFETTPSCWNISNNSEFFILRHVVNAVAWVFNAVQATLTAGDKLHQTLEAQTKSCIGD